MIKNVVFSAFTTTDNFQGKEILPLMVIGVVWAQKSGEIPHTPAGVEITLAKTRSGNGADHFWRSPLDHLRGMAPKDSIMVHHIGFPALSPASYMAGMDLPDTIIASILHERVVRYCAQKVQFQRREPSNMTEISNRSRERKKRMVMLSFYQTRAVEWRKEIQGTPLTLHEKVVWSQGAFDAEESRSTGDAASTASTDSNRA
ncbi:hypothetical protein PM082_011426 [Marasmius tenuissimus]|nr:hypothetical protein PM082_011426 [Marasmius tenuissimus]